MNFSFQTAIKYGAAVFIFFSFFLAISMFSDPDMPWHRAVGKKILETGEIPRFDEYSHTMPGFPWVDHEWALDAFFSWAYGNGFDRLLILLFTLLSAAPFLFFLRRAETLLEIWLILFSALAMFGIVGVRPQIISFFFFFILFFLLEKRFLSPSPLPRKKSLALDAFMLALFLVWANLHAGFAAGLLLLGIFLGADALTHRREKGIFGKTLRHGSFLVFAVFLTLINPYGTGLYEEIFTVMKSAEVREFIVEWRPYFDTRDFPKNIDFADARISYPFLFIFLLISFFRKYPLHLSLSSLVFFILFLRTRRMELLFLLTAIPLLLLGSKIVREKIGEEKIRKFFTRENVHKRTLPKTALATGAFFFLLIPVFFFDLLSYLSKKQPEDISPAIEFLNEERRSGKKIILLNEYIHGGTIIEQAPGMKVFIDGRMPHWENPDGTSAMKDYSILSYSRQKERLGEVLKRRSVNRALLSRKTLSKRPELVEYFRENQWRIGYENETMLIYSHGL